MVLQKNDGKNDVCIDELVMKYYVRSNLDSTHLNISTFVYA